MEKVIAKGLVLSPEYGAQIVGSMVTGTARLIHGSIPNASIITNLPSQCSVVVPVFVIGRSLRPQQIGELPPACAAVSRLLANQVSSPVGSALTRDCHLLYAAVALDPAHRRVTHTAEDPRDGRPHAEQQRDVALWL